MSREYLIKGLEDEDVKHYFNFMQKVGRFFLAEWDQEIHFLISWGFQFREIAVTPVAELIKLFCIKFPEVFCHLDHLVIVKRLFRCCETI